MQESLPLSWVRSEVSAPNYRHITLPFSRARWVAFADLPHGYRYSQIHSDFLSSFSRGFIIRGCSVPLAAYLSEQNCEVVQTGAEAVLSLNGTHMEKPSIHKLVKQARRRGKTYEIPMTEKNQEALRKFQEQTRHAGKPQLEHVFRTYPFDGCRCFAFLSPENHLLAALTLSMRSCKSVQTELILKGHGSPVGIMETLIVDVFEILRAEGLREWSLSEVPFYHLMQIPPERLSPKERMMVSVAALWKTAYNFDGLYRFKNKFAPEWRPVYLCANPGISLLMLTELAIKMRYANLALHEAAQFLRKPFLFA